jgi:hypothetical protein
MALQSAQLSGINTSSYDNYLDVLIKGNKKYEAFNEHTRLMIDELRNLISEPRAAEFHAQNLENEALRELGVAVRYYLTRYIEYVQREDFDIQFNRSPFGVYSESTPVLKDSASSLQYYISRSKLSATKDAAWMITFNPEFADVIYLVSVTALFYDVDKRFDLRLPRGIHVIPNLSSDSSHTGRITLIENLSSSQRFSRTFASYLVARDAKADSLMDFFRTQFYEQIIYPGTGLRSTVDVFIRVVGHIGRSICELQGLSIS